MNREELGELLTVKEAAARLKTSERALRQRIYRGGVKVLHLGASVRIPEGYLMEALGINGGQA